MSQEGWSGVDRYITDSTVHPSPALSSALEASVKAGLPQINVSPPQGKLLHILAKSVATRKILEIGTLGGYSTIWMASALARGGKLITLELDAKHAQVATANIARAGLGSKVEVILGAALETLPKLKSRKAGPFDLIFIDADKPNIPKYFAWAVKLSRRGTMIIVDNVIRSGAVADATSKDPSVQGVRQLNNDIAAEKKVIATTIQTVGSKGYDGFTIALVVAD